MIRYLGVDWGERRIGLALADSENMISTPFKNVSSPSELISIVETESINCVVLGNPIKMSGAESDNHRFLQFKNFLNRELGGKNVKIVLIDERLSSVQADVIMNKKMNKDRDSLAAMIILQTYLDQTHDKN